MRLFAAASVLRCRCHVAFAALWMMAGTTMWVLTSAATTTMAFAPPPPSLRNRCGISNDRRLIFVAAPRTAPPLGGVFGGASSSVVAALRALPVGPGGVAGGAASGGIDWPSLATFALQRILAAGIPAAFTLLVIVFAAKAFKGGKGERGGGGDDWAASESAVDELYDDLYGDPDSSQRGGKISKLSSLFPGGGRGGNKHGGHGIPSRNLGVPSKRYLKIDRLNDRYDSYSYSLTSATTSKALAAATLRERNFDRALERAASSSLEELTAAEKNDLMRAERELLKVGGHIMAEMRDVQRTLTDGVIREEMRRMDVEVGELDPEKGGKYEGVEEGEGVIVDAVIEEDEEEDEKEGAEANDETAGPGEDDEAKAANAKKKFDLKANLKFPLKALSSRGKSTSVSKDLKSLEQLNTELVKLELAFVRAVVEILGPERANGVRAAILGHEEGGVANAGALLKSLKERPLSAVLANVGYVDDTGTGGGKRRRKSVFVMDFPGDVTASQVSSLREEVTAVVRSARPGDEALLVLQSGGGTVTGYGLAAAQLTRFKERNIKLTVAVEQVAASGGYMMCCVADRIVASPFAVLGSIGVVSDTPNFYERLKKEGVEFQTVTAGKYKRTITPTKKPTREDIEKQKEELEDILALFKKFVATNRPGLDVDEVATGETWFGEDALDRGLCDEIRAVDDVLADYVDLGCDVYDVAYDPPPEEGAGLLAGLPLGSSSSVGSNGRRSGRIRAGAGEGSSSFVRWRGGRGRGGGGGVGPVRALARWLARTVVPAVAEEVTEEFLRQTDTTSGGGGVRAEEKDRGVSRRYVMKDDAADRIRAQEHD